MKLRERAENEMKPAPRDEVSSPFLMPRADVPLVRLSVFTVIAPLSPMSVVAAGQGWAVRQSAHR